MTPYDVSIFEFELFNSIYALAVMEKLVNDKLLYIPAIPVMKSEGYSTLARLSEKYPLPTYDSLANYAWLLLNSNIVNLKITKEQLVKLFTTAEVNNGYIL